VGSWTYFFKLSAQLEYRAPQFCILLLLYCAPFVSEPISLLVLVVLLYFCYSFLLRRFGFANPEALANGQTGTACRGEEHDVTLVWSITSGKRLVLADGQEVHYSSSRSPIFDFSWTMRGNHVLKIVAHASPPLSPTPGFRQYDFYVDGQSFFTFPKVYRLGLSPNDPRAAAGSPTGGGATRMAERGQRYNSYTASQRSGDTGIASLEAPHNPDEVSTRCVN